MRFPLATATALAALCLGIAANRDSAHAQSAPPGSAQPPARRISLAEALQVAVRQQPALAQAAIDVAVAEASVLEASGIEDWILRASAGLFRSRDEAVSGNIAGTNAVDAASLDASLSRLLPTGGTLSLHASGARRSSIYAFIGERAIEYTSAVTARLDQPLLRGRGHDVSRAHLSQSRHAAAAARLEHEAAVRQALQDVILRYWDLVYAHKALEISLSSLELVLVRRRLTEAGIRLGSAPQTALNEIDQIVATREEEILVAELTVSERSLELRRATGLEIGPADIDLAPVEELLVSPRQLDQRSIVERALAESPELAAVAERGEGARIAVQVTDNALLPRLDFSVELGPQGTSNRPGEALSNMVQVKGYTAAASLALEHALGQSAATGSHRAARENLHRIEVTAADLRAQIATAAVRAVKMADAASARMAISERAIELSGKNIEAEQRRYELGKATNFDVLQRQDEQRQARLRYARAAVDYLKAIAYIETLSGELLPRYGITVEDAGRPGDNHM